MGKIGNFVTFCTTILLHFIQIVQEKELTAHMASKEKVADMTVTTTELAPVLGVTGRRVQQLTQDGILTPVARGKFALGESVQAYITFLGRGTMSEDDKKLDTVKRKAEATLKASKAKIARAEADELCGKMHRSEDVAAMTADLIYTIRGSLMALPGRVAIDAAALSDPAEVAEYMRKEINKVMEQISMYEYDPEKYEARVRERRAWGDKDSTTGDDDDE